MLEIFQNIKVSGICSLDNVNSLFSIHTTPMLLLYSYIPVAFISLFLSITILRQNKKDSISILFFIFTAFFSLWVLDIVFQWISVPNVVIFTAAQLGAISEVGFYLSALYLLIAFTSEKKISKSTHALSFLFFFLILILTPTALNIKDYDYSNCEGITGILWYLIYGFEILVSFVVLFFGLSQAKKITDNDKKKEMILFTLSLSVFIGLFTVSNIVGEISEAYSFNLYGPIGMLVFIGFVTYLIVQYKAFNVKLASVQVLVWGLAFLSGSQFFFIETKVNYILTGITFVGVLVFGQMLVRSVIKEIKQKEKVLKLNVDLNKLVQQRESLVHLVTHKVKSSFTHTKYIFAGMLDNMFGPISPEIKKMAEMGLESDDNGVKTVDLILNASNLQKGTVKFDLKPINLKDIVESVINEKRQRVEEKGLKLNIEIKESEYNINGDAFWLKEVVNNLIENAFRYTKEGAIDISLQKKFTHPVENNKIVFVVKDTGVGISEEDKKNLFTEGGRGKESVKVNVDSTGYGLYTVKLVVEAHGGKVWAESDGNGKGSTFFVEFEAL